MKKVLVVMAVMVLFTAGCKNKKEENKIVTEEVICDVEIKNNESAIKYTDTIIFEDKKLVKISSEHEITFKKSENEDFYYEYLEKIRDRFHDVNGVEVSLDGHVLTVDMDITKMDDEVLSYYYPSLLKDDLVKDYENRGYTCK